MTSAYPPAPWRLAGPAVVVAGLVPLATARSLVPDGVRVLPVAPGHAAGVVLCAHYRSGDGSTLEYGEAAGLAGPVIADGATGGWVVSMVVDLEASQAGGREMWGLPKRLARFEWSAGACTVVDDRDEAYARFSWTPRGRRVPLPAQSRFMGDVGGPVRSAPLRGRFTAAPGARVEIPDGSPLSALRLRGPRIGLAGTIDAQAGAPRVHGR